MIFVLFLWIITIPQKKIGCDAKLQYLPTYLLQLNVSWNSCSTSYCFFFWDFRIGPIPLKIHNFVRLWVTQIILDPNQILIGIFFTMLSVLPCITSITTAISTYLSKWLLLPDNRLVQLLKNSHMRRPKVREETITIGLAKKFSFNSTVNNRPKVWKLSVNWPS